MDDFAPNHRYAYDNKLHTSTQRKSQKNKSDYMYF